MRLYGCCGSCGGSGRSNDPQTGGQCWDCRGSGHLHEEDPRCPERVVITDDFDYSCYDDEELPWPGPDEEKLDTVGTIKIHTASKDEITVRAVMDPTTGKVSIIDETGVEISGLERLPF